MRLHGGDQGFAAGHEGDALAQDAVDDLGVKPRHQPDAFAQRIGKIDLAAHGAHGDGFDLVAKARHDAQLIDAFLLDHGRIHVGDEQPLAAVAFGNQIHINGEWRQGPAEFFKIVGRGEVRRLAFGEPEGRRSHDSHDRVVYCVGARGCYENKNRCHDEPDQSQICAAYCRPHRQRQVCPCPDAGQGAGRRHHQCGCAAGLPGTAHPFGPAN